MTQLNLTRRQMLAASLALMASGKGGQAFANSHQGPAPGAPMPLSTRRKIRIGFLWSLTGQLSVIERPSHDVGLFWADSVNAAGGIAGYEVEPVIVDGQSDLKAYRQGITRLIKEENVLATFGGYISASRRAVMPIVVLNNSLFYYPTCYSGRECWQHIICTGPIANQHSSDLIPYMVEKFGPRVFFIGSNYVWPKESNRNARRLLGQCGGEVVGEAYMPLGLGEFGPIMESVHQRKPDWIFSTVIGISDLYFRQEYSRAGFKPDTMPTASLTTSEMEVKIMGTDLGEGHILSAPYFQTLGNAANRKFVHNFLNSRHGTTGVTHYNMEETYLSFLYFEKAVKNIIEIEGIEALSPAKLRAYSAGIKLSMNESPEGPVHIDPNNFNSWLRPRIGRFNSRGQIDLLSESTNLIPPRPYLLYPDRGKCRADGLHLPSGKIVPSAS